MHHNIGIKILNFDDLHMLSDDIKAFDNKRKLKRNYYLFYKGLRKRYYFYCQDCNEKRSMVIHHLDRDRKNNSKENLVFLCLNCHTKIHFLLGDKVDPKILFNTKIPLKTIY